MKNETIDKYIDEFLQDVKKEYPEGSLFICLKYQQITRCNGLYEAKYENKIVYHGHFIGSSHGHNRYPIGWIVTSNNGVIYEDGVWAEKFSTTDKNVIKKEILQDKENSNLEKAKGKVNELLTLFGTDQKVKSYSDQIHKIYTDVINNEFGWVTFEERTPKVGQRILIRYSYFGWEEVVALSENEIKDYKENNPQMRWFPIPDTGR